jgi:hypothetical protein
VSVLDTAREALRPWVLPASPAPEAARLAARVAEAGRGAVRSVLFFGSRHTGAAARDRFGAFDLFVVVVDYRAFYSGLKAAGQLRRSVGLVAWLNTWLAPNQVAFRAEPDAVGKLSVVSEPTFLRETGPLRRDHFCAGRLFQPAQCVWAADAAAGELALEGVAQAHAITLAWAGPWLPERFDAARYTRRLLELSLAREIRPEPSGRAETLWSAQRDYLLAVYARLLEGWADDGELAPLGDGFYRLARAPTGEVRRRLDAFFRRSKARATARWFKYVLTFDDWLDYIRRKAERHTGQPIVLAPRERRWPLLFLWPRFFRYLRDKDRRP